ncbi:uncharacterized protein [Asterias amurensis]|uniref:uncharacterized protein n=1 Tax=Asterias amurensis TaxID=7602 RepID=UPI003AB446CE
MIFPAIKTGVKEEQLKLTMEQFKLPEKESRLVKLGNTVYKIKLVYISKSNQSKPELPCDAITMQIEVEEAVRVVLTSNYAAVKTDHFLIHIEKKRWRAASLLTFTEDHQCLDTYPFMLMLRFQPREDVGNMPADNQAKSSSAASATQTTQGGRKRTRRYVVKEYLASDAKKSRSSDRSESDKGQSLLREEARVAVKETATVQSAEKHSRYLLRRGPIKATAPITKVQRQPKRPQEERAEYHLRSRDLELTSHNEDREKSDAPTVRTRSGDGNSDRAGSRGRRNRQGTQDHHGEAFHPNEDELPAYPEGGVDEQMDRHVQHPGRRNENQFQHAELIRLQKLAGIPRRPLLPQSTHYQLRPRGTFGRIIDALMTPVKNLFGQ